MNVYFASGSNHVGEIRGFAAIGMNVGVAAPDLDVGGDARPENIVVAFKMILKAPLIEVILVNIFAGISRCDEIARGILAAREQCQLSVPVVIRLKGTNEAQGRALLEGTSLVFAETLDEGAARAVEIGGSV